MSNLIDRQVEHGTDDFGAEYKRTQNDFHLRFLTQENCACSICHGCGAKWEFRYVTRNYKSHRTGKICKTLQANEHSFWLCPKCLENMAKNTCIQIHIGGLTNERPD